MCDMSVCVVCVLSLHGVFMICDSCVVFLCMLGFCVCVCWVFAEAVCIACDCVGEGSVIAGFVGVCLWLTNRGGQMEFSCGGKGPRVLPAPEKARGCGLGIPSSWPEVQGRI